MCVYIYLCEGMRVSHVLSACMRIHSSYCITGLALHYIYIYIWMLPPSWLLTVWPRTYCSLLPSTPISFSITLLRLFSLYYFFFLLSFSSIYTHLFPFFFFFSSTTHHPTISHLVQDSVKHFAMRAPSALCMCSFYL